MNLDNSLQALGSIRDRILRESGPGNIHEICQQFLEVVGSMLASEESDFEEELQGLTSSLDLLATLLSHFPHSHGTVKPLVQKIFSECARKVLGVEFQKLKEDDDQRASFMAAVEALCIPTQDASVRRLFMALQWTLENCWAHPTLVSMMKGEDIEETKALHYLEKLELGEVFRLRIELLVESGCDQYALNLCNWCVRSSLYRQDVFVRQTQLLLLHKFGKLQDFYNQCWTLECCVGVRMVESLLEDEDKRAVCLTLAQTFLLQDWMQPEKRCCTKELLRLWMHAQRLSESDNEEFLSSVSKVAQITRVPTQLVLLIEVMQAQFGSEFLSFCTELALRALKLDRHRLDSARVKKEDEEADSAADGLAKTCRQISQLYQEHHHMCLSSLLTALYLDPKPDLFFAIESKMSQPHKRSPPRINNVDQAMFKELLDLVEGLRPIVLHPRHGWKEIKKTALFHLENAGYSYDSAKNSFTNLEELLIQKRQMTRKKSKSKTTKQKRFKQFVPKSENVKEEVEVSLEIPEQTALVGEVTDVGQIKTGLEFVGADSSGTVFVQGDLNALPSEATSSVNTPETNDTAVAGDLIPSDHSQGIVPSCVRNVQMPDIDSQPVTTSNLYPNTQLIDYNCIPEVAGTQPSYEPQTVNSSTDVKLETMGQAVTNSAETQNALGAVIKDEMTAENSGTEPVAAGNDMATIATAPDNGSVPDSATTTQTETETLPSEPVSSTAFATIGTIQAMGESGVTKTEGVSSSPDNSVGISRSNSSDEKKETIVDESTTVDSTTVSQTNLIEQSSLFVMKSEPSEVEGQSDIVKVEGAEGSMSEESKALPDESVPQYDSVIKDEDAPTTEQLEVIAAVKTNDMAALNVPAVSTSSENAHVAAIQTSQDQALVENQQSVVESQQPMLVEGQQIADGQTLVQGQLEEGHEHQPPAQLIAESIAPTDAEIAVLHVNAPLNTYGEAEMVVDANQHTESQQIVTEYPVTEGEVLMTIDEPQKVIVCPAEETVLEGRAVLIGDEMTVETEVESTTHGPDTSIVQEAVDEVEVSTELSPDSTSKVKSFNGQFCESSPSESPVEDHSAEASDDEEEVLFSCAYCSKPFNTMAQRRRHQEWLCSLKVAKHSCQKCGRTYQTERSLYKHIRVAHRLSVEDVLKNVKLPPDLVLKPCSVSLERLGTAILDRYNITIKVKKKKASPKSLSGPNSNSAEKADSLKTIKKEKKVTRPGDSPTKRPSRRPKPVKKPGQTEEQILIDGLIMPQTFEGGLENGYQEEVMEETVMEIPYIQGPITEAYDQLQSTPQHTAVLLHTPVVTPTVHPDVQVSAPQLRVMTGLTLKQPELLVTHVSTPQRPPAPTTPVKSVAPHIPGTPRDHSCRYCREKYTNERARLKHERDCAANPHSTEEVVCEFCGGIYKGLLSLNSHLLARHTPDAPKGDKEEHSRSGVLDDADDKQKRMAPKKKLKLYKNIFVYMIIEIHCGSCDSIFGDKNYCRQHQRKSCSEDNGMRKIVKYCCKYCEEAFMTMNNCYQHCLKCEKCPTGDPVKDAETSIYRCTEKECKRAFISQVSLKAHILSVHYIRGNATNVRFTPGASSKSRAKKAAATTTTPVKKDGATTAPTTTQEPATDNQANFNLAGLSAAEFEQAINMPNVDGFLKLLEDDSLIDSHWDLSEPFQGQGQGQTATQGQTEGHAAEPTSQGQVVVTQVVTTANHHAGAVALPPLPSWVKTTSRTQWNTVPGGAANTVQPIGQPQVLQVSQIPHHLKPTLIQAGPGLTSARLSAPQAKLLQDKSKARPRGQTVVNAQTIIIPQTATTTVTVAATKKPPRPRPPRPKPKSPQESPEPDTSLASSPSVKQDDEESEEDGLPKKKPHFGGRQPWLVNGKKFMTFRNAPMLRTAIHMCKKCHSKFEDEAEGNAHVEKCGDDKNILLKTRRFYCVYCDHVSESAKKCRDHLIKTCLPAMNIDPATVLNPRYGCKEEGCDKQFFVRFFLIKHMVSDHGREREEFKSKKKDIDDFSLPSELNERLPDYIKECLPQEFTKRRKEGKDMVTQRRKQRKESDSTTFTEGSEVSQMSIGSSGQPNYLESSSGAGSVQNIQEQLKEEEALEQQYMMQVGEGNNAALVTAPMVAQYVHMSTVSDEAGVVQNVGALLLQCASSESVHMPPNITTTSAGFSGDKLPSISRCQEPTRRNSQGDLEEMGQAIQQGAQDVSNALQNAQQDLTPGKLAVGPKARLDSDSNIILTSHVKGKVNEEYLKLSQQQTVWATRNKNVVPVMSIPGPISSTLPISRNHVIHATTANKGILSGQVHLQRGTQPTTLMPPVVMTTHVTGGNIARPQAVRPGQLISPQAPSTPASSQISESVDSESSPSPSPEPLPEPEDGRISPVVDALLARIKAKTKKLEEKNRLKAANKQKMSAAAKRRKRDSSSGSVQSAMSPGASSVSSLPSSAPAPSPGQTPTPPLPQPGSLTAQTIFNHIHPASPDADKSKTEELRCEECDLAFNTKSLLTYHQKYSCAAKFGSHNKMDDRVCRYCKATFHHKVALKYHVGKCRTMMLENAQQPSTLATVEEDSVESVNDRDSTLNSPTPKKKHPMEGPIQIDQSRENLMKTLERKVMCHADVVNPMSPRTEWNFKCKYCQEGFGSKLMSLHSHVVARHPDMYKKVRAKDHGIKLLQNQNSISNSYSDLANADDLSLLSLDTSNDLALISDLALLTAEMEASKGTFSKLSVYDHEKKLVCDLCENEREFEKESSLLYHLKCVHGKDIPKLDLHCPQCKGLTFENDVLLHEHMKSKHGIDSLLMPGSKLPFNLRQAGHLESQVYHVQGQIFQNQNNQQQGQGDSQGQGQSEQVSGTVDTSQLQSQSPAPQQVVEGQAVNAPGQIVMTSMSTDQISNPALVSSGGLAYTSVPLTTSIAGSAGMPVVVGNSISMTVPTTSVTLQTADGQIIHTSVPTSLLQDGGLSALSGAQVLPTGEIALPLITTQGQPPMLLQTVAPGQVLFTHSASPHGQSSPALTAVSSQASPAQPKKKPVKKKFPEGEGNDDKAKKKRATPAKPRPSPSGTGASFKPELDPEKWKCRYCDMGFPRRQDMRDHIKYTHRVPGAYPGPLPTKSATIVKDRDDDGDPHDAVLRQGTDILQQALSMIGEGPSTDTGDSLASTSDSATGSNIVIQQTTDGGQILAPQVLDMPVSMDFDMGVSTLENTGHQNMTVLPIQPIQQLGLVSAASTIDPSLLLQHPGITMSTLAQVTPATSTVSIAHYSQEGVMQSGQETSMEAEINDVLRQASMAAGIFEDEPSESSNAQEEETTEAREAESSTEERPANYSATEHDEYEEEESLMVKDEQNVEEEADSSQQPTGNGSEEPEPGNGGQHEQEELNTSSDDNQADTSTEDITHNQTDGHVDPRRSRYRTEALEALQQEAASSSIVEADSTIPTESAPQVESSFHMPEVAASSGASPCEAAEAKAPVVDQNGSDTQDSPASSQATIIDTGTGNNQKTDEGSSEATELPSTAESSGTESPAYPDVGKKDLYVKIDKLAMNPQSSVKVSPEESEAKPAESGSRSPGQGERWSLRPRKRKESADEGRGKRSKTDDSEKGDTEDDGKKSRRRRSTDSNVSSGASEHSSVSRNSGGATPRSTGGSPRSRRASEDSRGGVSRRVLRNTVKTVPEEETAKTPAGRRASKSK